MALFRKPKDTSPVTPEPTTPTPGQPARKDRPTPSRREAESARMARLHPELNPKTAKRINRESSATQRQRQLTAVDALPARQLIRDVIDSRLNIGEVALPILLSFVALSFIPALSAYASVIIWVMWAFLILLVGDSWLMWRTFKKLAVERIPDQSLRGLLFYGWNRQLSFRRWRQPAPRVKRGDKI